MTQPVLIAFGANIDPLVHIRQGLQKLHQHLGIEAISKVYRTTPVGNLDQPDFLNGTVHLRKGLPPGQLRDLLRDIEAGQNRRRQADPNAPRTLDLDIALLGNMVVNNRTTTIPDPDILTRPFLAIPLAELAPTLIHPIEKVSLIEIAQRFSTPPIGMVLDSEATRLIQSSIPPG
ncbi:MAG: 2-amino-4-hydroxy-6-hydroxymethyldihydropteridine diphosphokinase [Magnetococcales bacterium]|nr:2-amino-4-hydroxy-6-hydroxymethyldihydropteridine diphosphokinase [Magnetococcales bacterium]